MSAFFPPWSQRYGAEARGQVPNQQMRVSDAERSEVADSLSKHYSDGRLDETEFNDRLQKAMSAKTRGDLAGLLDDLPPIAPPPPPVTRRRGRGRAALLVVAAVLFAMAVSSTMWTWHFPWVLFALVIFFVWRSAHRHSGWHRHNYGDWGGPGSPTSSGTRV
jgi:Domain of unknown function (DUF1707)